MRILTTLTFFSSLFISLQSLAHSPSPKDWEISDWHSDQILQVRSRFTEQTKDAGNKECITSPYIVFDVKDSYAFDIDETVDISFDIDLKHQPSKLWLQYDKNGSTSDARSTIVLPKTTNKRWHRQTIRLERARFSGRTIGWGVGDFVFFSHRGENTKLTVCDIRLKRSYKTPKRNSAQGYLNLSVHDETGQAVPARIGLYDSSNRMPLLDSQALDMPYFEDTRKNFLLDENRVNWPNPNHRAFYIDKEYQQRLPIGRYQVVVGRGLEYQTYTTTVEIKANKESELSIKLSRVADFPARGWHPGEMHIHASRRHKSNDKALSAIAQAEDLRVANIMHVGDIGKTYYPQYAWGKASQYSEGGSTLVSGQEDPRTNRMGHTLHANLTAPVRNSERYYQYNEVFDAVHKQGGLSGFAHGGGNGLWLDLPFGRIDFIEMQMLYASSKQWFDALNLGYKLTPAAGSDYPHMDDLVGGSRMYVQTGKDESPQAWFDGVRAGKVFVTNGPMLSLSINGKGIGSEMDLAAGDTLAIEASALLNPDINKLAKLELIHQGKVIAEATATDGQQALKLTREIKADKGGWFVVRAQGSSNVAHPKWGAIQGITAYSAPIYVRVNGQGWCEPKAVADIVKRIKRDIQVMMGPIEEKNKSLDFPEENIQNIWSKNKDEVSDRIRVALKEYDQLVELSKSEECI